MKALGLVLIVAVALGFGFYTSFFYLSELKKIQTAEEIITTLIMGLENGNLSLREIFRNLKKEDSLSEAFCTIENNLMKGIEPFEKEKADKLGFGHDKETVENLWKAFFVLGKSSAAEQTEKMRFYRENIRNRYQVQDEFLHKKAKLSRSMGLLGGLFLAIILY